MPKIRSSRVLGGQRVRAHRHARQVDALVVLQRAAVDHLACGSAASCPCGHPQLEQAVIQQDAVAHVHVRREVRVRGGDDLVRALHVLGGDGELATLLQLGAAGRRSGRCGSSGPAGRPGCPPPCGLARGRAQLASSPRAARGCRGRLSRATSMPASTRPWISALGLGRTKGADNLCSTHEASLCLSGFQVTDRKSRSGPLAGPVRDSVGGGSEASARGSWRWRGKAGAPGELRVNGGRASGPRRWPTRSGTGHDRRHRRRTRPGRSSEDRVAGDVAARVSSTPSCSRSRPCCGAGEAHREQ